MVILTTGLLKPVNTHPEGLYFAKLRCEFDFTEVKKDNISAISVPVDCFVPLDQSTNLTRTRAGLDATFLGLPTWFRTIKTSIDPKADLATHVATNVIIILSAQSEPFVLTELPFDSA